MKSRPEPSSQDLPLQDNGIGTTEAPAAKTSSVRLPSWHFIFAIPLLMMLGGVIGLYFQPPGLKAFFGLTGLTPGGGTDTPIAQAIERVQAQQEIAVISEGDIVALGRLLPAGKVVAVALPYGSSDARVQALNVKTGQTVAEGDVLAVLDNQAKLQNALNGAQANLQVSQANLLKTQETIRASRLEAEAALARAQTTAVQAQAELNRLTPLLTRGVTTASAIDAAQAKADEAARDVERYRATLSRYEASSGAVQADIAVAEANVFAAKVEVERATSDLDHAVVRAPISGTVLDINTRVGERPGTQGLLDLGDTSQMIVEAEVYQTMIGRVAIGDPVSITAQAVGEPLSGRVQAIGLEINRQSITSDDPAANTDARVVDVIIELDAPSSERAKRFTNLETVVRIDAGRVPDGGSE